MSEEQILDIKEMEIGKKVQVAIQKERRDPENFKRKIRQLEEGRRHIEKINEINKQYFANVAHQLRTPLTMIFGPLETLRASAETKNTRLEVRQSQAVLWINCSKRHQKCARIREKRFMKDYDL